MIEIYIFKNSLDQVKLGTLTEENEHKDLTNAQILGTIGKENKIFNKSELDLECEIISQNIVDKSELDCEIISENIVEKSDLDLDCAIISENIVNASELDCEIISKNVVELEQNGEASTYPNSLMKNHKYYIANKTLKEYVVARTFTDTLVITDFLTLDKKRHLTNFLIDFYFELFIEKFDHFQYFPSHFVTFNILSQKSTEFLKTVTFNRRFTILPVHVKHPVNENLNHWCMIILDVKLKYFYFINSIQRTHAETVKYFTKFGFFLKKLQQHQPHSNLGSLEEWKVMASQENNLQNDGYNCGVHIIHFVQQFATYGKTFNDMKFNADVERDELKKFIIKNSKCMNSICLSCGREDEPGIPKNSTDTDVLWVECDNCKRWLHSGCLKQKTDATKEYFCPLCSSKENRKI